MIYPVYVYGSAVLRRESKNIDKNFEGLDKLLSDMFETMYASNGVGLAAPQIGKNLRIFVIDASPMADEEEPELADFKRVFINPEIYEESEEAEYMEEGCLSVPNIREEALRPIAIRVRYLNEKLEPQDEEFTGFAARVVQHEYDHIEGRLFIDWLSPLRKRLIKSKLDKIAKGDYKSDFPTKLVK